MPTGDSLPSMFRAPRQRARVEWHRLKSRFQDLKGLFYYKFMIRKRPWPKLGSRRQLGNHARNLQYVMYNAFAEGDLEKLKAVCTEGLYKSFSSRIKGRRHNERFRWILYNDIGNPRVVSNRATTLPISGLSECGLRQVVVRLRSKQSLRKLIRSGKEDKAVTGTGIPKDITEYLVIQLRMIKGQEAYWKVWGTMDESDVKDIVAGKKVSVTM